jgi:hypothetical protein
VFPSSSRVGGARVENTTHTYTGRKRKGKKPSLNILLAALLEMVPQRVLGCHKGLPLLPWFHEPSSPHAGAFYDVDPGFPGDLYSL